MQPLLPAPTAAPIPIVFLAQALLDANLHGAFEMVRYTIRQMTKDAGSWTHQGLREIRLLEADRMAPSPESAALEATSPQVITMLHGRRLPPESMKQSKCVVVLSHCMRIRLLCVTG